MPYVSPRVSGSTGYRSPRVSRGAPLKRKSAPSALGFLGNLARDIEGAVVGLGPGLLELGKFVSSTPGSAGFGRRSEANERFLRNVAESYRYQYAPLVRGDLGEFGHRLYERPLGPILDAATVLSLGATGAARMGLAPAALRRGTIQLRLPNDALVERPLPRQTLRAEMQVAADAALKKLPRDFPKLGESARAGRVAVKAPRRVARSRELLEQPFLKALHKVPKLKDRVATFWLTQVPLTDDLGRLTRQWRESGDEIARLSADALSDPKVLAAYQNPTPKQLAVIEQARGVAEAQAAVLGITPEVARRRAYLPTLLARGARFTRREGERVFVPPPSGMQKVTRPRTLEEVEARLADLEKQLDKGLRPIVDQIAPPAVRQREQAMRNALPHARGKRAAAGLAAKIELEGFGGTSRSVLQNAYAEAEEIVRRLAAKEGVDPVAKKVAALLDERDALRDVTQRHGAAWAFDEALPPLGDVTELVPAPGFRSVEEMIEQIDADLAAAGRPRPVYMPHTSERPQAVHVYGAGGAGPQARPSPLRETMGVLLQRGQLIQEPSVLRHSFIRSVKYALYRDIHQMHVEYAVPVEELPKGWRFVRIKHGDTFPYTARTAREFREFADEVEPVPAKPGSEAESFAAKHLDEEGAPRYDKPEVEFTTTSRTEAVPTEDGRFLAVPESFSHELTGEFTRSNRFLYYLNRYPVRVWRHLVLKLRPAWLVNNIVGNALLYLVHSSDPVALQELGRAFKRAFPRKADDFDEILRKHFPEQVHGTFMGSQLPALGMYGKGARIERVTSFVGAGLAQVDRAWEQALRSAIVRTELRKAPELRAFAGKMRRQTDDFWKLADEDLTRNPLLAERIHDRISDALGDYLALGRFERDLVCAAFPFYAWYRVITLITLKLPLTHPLKANLLAHLGQAGAVSALESLGVPEENAMAMAKGFFAFGPPDKDERVAGLSTKSANPFATLADMQTAVIRLARDVPSLLGLTRFGIGSEPEYGQRPAWADLPGVNPFFKAPIETWTGTNTYGRPGLLGAVPQIDLAYSLLGKDYKGKPGSPTLYDRTAVGALLRYLGIPYARISPERVQEIGTGH